MANVNYWETLNSKLFPAQANVNEVGWAYRRDGFCNGHDCKEILCDFLHISIQIFIVNLNL